MCFSKAHAVRVLRHRGMSRDGVRAIVNKVLREPNGYETVETDAGRCIAIQNEQWLIEAGHYPSDMTESKRFWAAAPEF